jgi:hypothetical protein
VVQVVSLDLALAFADAFTAARAVPLTVAFLVAFSGLSATTSESFSLKDAASTLPRRARTRRLNFMVKFDLIYN